MTEREEAAWMLGNRAAWVELLNKALSALGYKSDEAGRVAWIAEREAAVAILRTVCRDHGSNDWPDNLNLADVIDKYLRRHLEAGNA